MMADRHHEKGVHLDHVTDKNRATVSAPGPDGLREYKPPQRAGRAKEVDGPWEWDDQYGWLFLHHPTNPQKHPRDGGPEPPWRASNFPVTEGPDAAMPAPAEAQGPQAPTHRGMAGDRIGDWRWKEDMMGWVHHPEGAPVPRGDQLEFRPNAHGGNDLYPVARTRVLGERRDIAPDDPIRRQGEWAHLVGAAPEVPPDRPRAVPGVPLGAEGASHERPPVPRPQSGPVVSAGAPPSFGPRPQQPQPGMPWGFPGGPALPPPRAFPGGHPMAPGVLGLPMPPELVPPEGPELRQPLPPYQPRSRG
jgi:hypothetical protein